jgi:hypothetical protein
VQSYVSSRAAGGARRPSPTIDFGVATSDNAARVDLFLDDARVAELTRYSDQPT